MSGDFLDILWRCRSECRWLKTQTSQPSLRRSTERYVLLCY